MAKVCSQCKRTLEFSQFHKYKDGLRAHCKDCRKIERRKRYLDNYDRERANEKRWRDANRRRFNRVSAERSGRRRAKVFCKCCTREDIIQFYLKCPEGWHVDHVIPINNNGAHCVSNLQYLTHGDHTKKTWRERWGNV